MFNNLYKYCCYSLAALLLLFTAGCKQKPKIANKFYEHYHNKVYQDFDTVAYYAEFKQQLAVLKPADKYTADINTYYKSRSFEPYFVDKFLFNGELHSLVKYLKNVKADGINPALFDAATLEADLDTIDANHFTAIGRVYPLMVKLEIETATALLTYSSIMQYGVVNPDKIYRRYDIPAKQPDSLLFEKVLSVDKLSDYLDSIQPKSEAYKALKKELAGINTDVIDNPKLQRMLTIKLNMERLRWQIPPKESRYLWVNIPAFNLQMVDSGKPAFDMKVCVGEPKPNGYDTLFKRYLKTHNIDDKPLNHETTMLYSRINEIQLNPTWSIPASIAESETYYAILKDPDYLTNNNIRVYYKGSPVNNPDSIHWSKISRQNMPYSFKQDASQMNALGKFKFIFDNESSIYLHDTPNKKGFTKAWRAISHGCVRVEDPFKLAETLIGDTSKLDNIRMEVGIPPQNPKDTARYKAILAKRAAPGFELKSKYIGLKPDMQLYIDYYTCWPDTNGKINFYYDVYKMDPILEKAMGKYLSKN